MPANTKISDQSSVALKHPKQYKVILYNDDFTPMDLVVDILMKIFHKSYEEAASIMMSIHKGKKGLAGIYSYDIAMTKARKAIQTARDLDYPLRVEVEEA